MSYFIIMKVLVTGAAGMLGGDLCNELEKEGHEVLKTDINLIEENIKKLDVRNKEEVFSLIEQFKPELVAHLAAETDVDKCERHDIVMAYISTAGVFDGTSSEPYTEFHKPNPINVYGKSKYEGEKIVETLLNKYFIIRAGWMMGGGPKRDKKFVIKLLKQIEEGKKDIYVLTDKTGTPTYTVDFSRTFVKLIETGNYGLYHLTNKGECSRYNVAKKIFEL